MKKNIKIGNNEYEMKSSAYTQFKYKNETGRSLLKDLSSFAKTYEKVEDKDMLKNIDGLDDTLELVFKLAYIMIIEANDKQVSSYDDLLKNTDNYLENSDWIGEVVELATSPLSGGIQAPQNNG